MINSDNTMNWSKTNEPDSKVVKKKDKEEIEETNEDDGEEDMSVDKAETTPDNDKPNLISLSCWDYSIELECLKGSEDLQLAAELGKTLLERNKELETSLRQCQNIIEEQTQEIEYLTKQSTALRKTNDNRIRIYEQLEVGIQELERANQRLALDNSADKKQIKALCAYRDVLEARCDELQKALDEAKVQQTIQKEKLRRLSKGDVGGDQARVSGLNQETASPVSTPTPPSPPDQISEEEEDNLINQLSTKNQELKSQMSKDQRKIGDLEEELCRRVQDMAMLEEELCQKEEQVKSLREKVSGLEELRLDNVCTRCFKEVAMPREHQRLFDPEEEDESLADNQSYTNEVHMDSKEDNPYRTLADMYDSLIREQAENRKLSREFAKSSPLNCLSLQEELKPFNFNNVNKEPTEDEEAHIKDERKEVETKNSGKRKGFGGTGGAGNADFSEAETSSSGYSDETSNKSTQTERNMIPGSFLCSIADGDDCKFSIYDDACPFESRFRKTPEYRTLFREIFAVLKRAAEAKDHGEQLPLLNDDAPGLSEVPHVPPVTPANEQPPMDFEDVQSLTDSMNPSEVASEVASETSSMVGSRLDTLKDNSPEDESSSATPDPSKKNGARDARLTNDILEYISISLGVKKKSKRKSNDSPARRIKVSELVDRIESASPNASPRKSGSGGGNRRRKEWRNYDSNQGGSRNQSPSPHILTTLKRNETPPNASGSKSGSVWSYQPFVSTAAQEVAKLKKLEKSYAEVLKHRPAPKSYSRTKIVQFLS